MPLDSILSAIEDSGLGTAIRGDSGWSWLFPVIETVHVMAICAVVGTVLMVDLRLLGISSRDSAVSKLSTEVLPYTWTAFVAAVLTGALMFTAYAQTYVHNIQFQMKFLLMALAGINMAVFHLGIYRRVLDWDYALPPPLASRIAGALSILLWLGVIFFGRWIGFATNI